MAMYTLSTNAIYIWYDQTLLVKNGSLIQGDVFFANELQAMPD